MQLADRTWAWLCLVLIVSGSIAAVGLYGPNTVSGDGKAPLAMWALFIGLVWFVGRRRDRMRTALLFGVAFVSAQAWISYSAKHVTATS